MKPSSDYCHRFPAEIINHAVWLHHVFSLSRRDVELILVQRGIVVFYETVQRRCTKFAPGFADHLQLQRPRPRDEWRIDGSPHPDPGVQHYLWRAVG